MMVEDLKQAGTLLEVRERLNILVNTPASSAVHARSTRPGIPSWPAAFLMLMCI